MVWRAQVYLFFLNEHQFVFRKGFACFCQLSIWSKLSISLTSLDSYLTNNMPNVERFPLSFKSQFSGNHFYHIVLGVQSGGRFGALGISRREDLMFKPLEFRTLMDLVQEFEGAYRGYWHTLRKVKIGQYVSHDPHSVEQIEWKHSILDVDKLSKEELRKELERHTRDMRLKVQIIVATCNSLISYN